MAFVQQTLDKARHRLVALPDDAPLLEAARLLRAGTDIIAICDHAGVLCGIITKTDVIEHLTESEGLHRSMTASSVMKRQVLTCNLADNLNDIWTAMRASELKNVPIIDANGRPVGILNARDALAILLQESEDEESLLRDYVMGIGYR